VARTRWRRSLWLLGAVNWDGPSGLSGLKNLGGRLDGVGLEFEDVGSRLGEIDTSYSRSSRRRREDDLKTD
jgi:hypothetical protein